MRLDQESESSNIEDRRGSGMSRGVVGGGMGAVLTASLPLPPQIANTSPNTVMSATASSAPSSQLRRSARRKLSGRSPTAWSGRTPLSTARTKPSAERRRPDSVAPARPRARAPGAWTSMRTRSDYRER